MSTITMSREVGVSTLGTLTDTLLAFGSALTVYGNHTNKAGNKAILGLALTAIGAIALKYAPYNNNKYVQWTCKTLVAVGCGLLVKSTYDVKYIGARGLGLGFNTILNATMLQETVKAAI